MELSIEICVLLGCVLGVILLFILIGFFFLSYDWWKDAGPNDGKPYDNRQKQ